MKAFKSQSGNYIAETGAGNFFWFGPRGRFLRPAAPREWDYARAWGEPETEVSFALPRNRGFVGKITHADTIRGIEGVDPKATVWVFCSGKGRDRFFLLLGEGKFHEIGKHGLRLLRELDEKGLICSVDANGYSRLGAIVFLNEDVRDEFLG